MWKQNGADLLTLPAIGQVFAYLLMHIINNVAETANVKDKSVMRSLQTKTDD